MRTSIAAPRALAAPKLSLLASALTALLGVAALPVPVRGQDAPDATRMVVAIVRGLRNDRGHIRGAIYPTAERFTREGQGTATCLSSVRARVSRCVFENVPPGHYAIGVMHDEDDDGHFDQGFMGIPEEGYGFSRDAHGTLGPPSFESAAFDFDGRAMMSVDIMIRYGI